MQCISSSSPVCALIPPTDETLTLVEELRTRDLSSDFEVLKAKYRGKCLLLFFVLETKTCTGDNTNYL